MATVSPKLVLFHPSPNEMLLMAGMFDLVLYSLGWSIAIVKVAFRSGSSRQGKALRASVG